ncbi:MAG: GNAT family N-acetyltransferase [Actinomycetota bacterium]|nr:GNAT family N-acetyltransferase [Actinomycetota bacterium]
MRPAGEATLTSIGEAELADWKRDLGERVVLHEGRWWHAVRPGFYRPVHHLARLTAEQATRPAVACWGFHASLRDEDAAQANTMFPTHRVTNLDEFDESHLSSNRRYQLRKARRLSEVVELTGPRLLLEQGYEVLRSAMERTGHGRMPSREEFAREIEVSVRPGRRFVLAGLVDGKLAGYIEGNAVDGVGYLGELYVATEALGTNVSSALQFEFALICRRSEGITELVHGVEAKHDEKLTMFKERLGFPVNPVPARISMLPGTGALIRRLAPSSYYRLTA